MEAMARYGEIKARYISMEGNEKFETLFHAHLADIFKRRTQLTNWSQGFLRDGYAKVTEAIPPPVFKIVQDEVLRLVSGGIRRDFLMKQTSDTPRRMRNVSRHAIAKESQIIPAVYECRALTNFLGIVADDELVPCWDDEQYIITAQDKKGDTHGWHWDDFPFSLIWIIECPEVDCGGMLQCVPHTRWDKENPTVNETLVNNVIRTYHHRPGDVYFFRSDTTLHRTVPLSRDAVRIILNTSWASRFDRRQFVSHETMLSGFVDDSSQGKTPSLSSSS
jgi:hypothetical protein